MYLVKTALRGTQFCVVPVENQENSLPIGTSEHHTFIGETKLLTKYPIGTVFAISDAIWGTLSSNIVGPIRPIFQVSQDNKLSVYVGTVDAEITATQEDVIYTYQTMVNSSEFRVHAKDFAESVALFGYKIDTEKAKSSAGISTDGTTLRERIMLEYPCPTKNDIGFHIDSDVWYLLIRNILRGENTLLIGPTGSGKTEIVSHIAKAMGKKLTYQDMGTVQDAQSALLGVHRLNKDGHSSFDYAPFVTNVQEEGIVLLDELNRAPLSAANILFPCLDKRRYLPIDIACADSVRNIPVNDKCVFFATANLGAEYSGTTQIDRALLDRFFPIELSYPDQESETQVLMIRTGVSEKTAKAIVRVSSTIRDQFKAQELSNVVSVRHTLAAASLIHDGFDIVGALMKVVMPLFEDDGGVSERTKVKSIIAAN